MDQARSTSFSSFVSSIWLMALLGLSTWAGLKLYEVEKITDLPGLDHLPSFLLTPLTTQTENQIILTLASVIAGFSVLFFLGYVGKAIVDALRLMFVTHHLRRARATGQFESPHSDVVTWYWSSYPLFSRLWREFAKSLHSQPHPDSAKKAGAILYRSTLPAEMVFNQQTLVDVPMRVEFFRHLPGILTGAGIVSTFAGILVGLTEFNPAVPAELVTHELKNLFVGVSTAFVASFFAIFSAISITIIEKFILQWRYNQVLSLQGFLDDCFQTGAEPEYLAKLVENGSSGMKRLENGLSKLADSLNGPNDLGAHSGRFTENLDLLLNRLSESLSSDQKRSVHLLETAIREGFSAPLRAISQAVEISLEAQSRNQEEIRRLEGRLAGFGERMDVALSELARGMGGFRDSVQQLSSKQQASLETLDRSVNKIGELAAGQLQEGLLPLISMADDLKKLRELAESQSVTQAILSAMQESDLHHDLALSEALEKMEKRVATQLERLDSQQHNLSEISLNSVVGEASNTLKETALRLFTSEKNLPPQAIINAINDANARQEMILTQTLKELETQTVSGIQSATEQITQKVANGTQAVQESISVASQKIILTSDSDANRAILASIQGARDGLEKTFMQIAQELSSKTSDLLQESTRSLEEKLTESTEEILTAPATSDDKPTEQLLNDFKDQLRQLITSLADRINHVGDRISIERIALEANLNRLGNALRSATESQGELTKQHVEQVLSHSQEQLQSDMSRLDSHILHQLEQLQEVVRQTSNDLSNRLSDQTTQSEQDNHQISQEIVKKLDTDFRATLEQINQQQSLIDEARDKKLLAEVLENSQQLVGQVYDSVKNELVNTNRFVTDTIRQTQSEQSQENKMLAEQILATVSEKMASSVTEIASGLSLLRNKVTDEKENLNHTMQEWINELTTFNQEESQEMAARIKGVMDQIDNRHSGMIEALNQLNHGLGTDLLNMKENIIARSQESEQRIEHSLFEMGDGVKSSVSRSSGEQMAFIELLSERLETMRKKLRIR
ncbi:MAG: hypothetical protein HQL67_01260 [Magnetococcales bacterium]|nr:hypothetical protein [Magnetococcales bacterium]